MFLGTLNVVLRYIICIVLTLSVQFTIISRFTLRSYIIRLKLFLGTLNIVLGTLHSVKCTVKIVSWYNKHCRKIVIAAFLHYKV